MSPARVEPDSSKYSGRVAKRIRQLRDERGLTMQEVVERMKHHGYDVKVAAISHWETGHAKVNLDAIPALAAALGVQPSDFFPNP